MYAYLVTLALVIATCFVLIFVVVNRLYGAFERLLGKRRSDASGIVRVFFNWIQMVSMLQAIKLQPPEDVTNAMETAEAANVSLEAPAGVTVVPVVSTEDLQREVLAAADDADAVVMAAAPADFRPTEFVTSKIKKTADGAAPQISLVENPDILAGLVTSRGEATAPVLVGFAAETGDADASVLEHARAKLQRKGCDLLVVNDVGDGRVFGRDDTEAVILSSDGSATEVAPGPKIDLAHAIWDTVVQRMDA